MKSSLVVATILILGLVACGKPANETAATADQPSVTSAAAPAALERTASPSGARVFFIRPTDGETLKNPVRIEFGIERMDVVKAGNDQPDSGHHHLLIDTGLPPLGLPIPADANYVHFGDGSQSTEITLPPGTHTLSLLLGDHRHIPHEPPVASAPITVTIE
jgi:hypothetical protein